MLSTRHSQNRQHHMRAQQRAITPLEQPKAMRAARVASGTLRSSDTTSEADTDAGTNAVTGCTDVRLHRACSTSTCIAGDVVSTSTAVNALKAPW